MNTTQTPTPGALAERVAKPQLRWCRAGAILVLEQAHERWEWDPYGRRIFVGLEWRAVPIADCGRGGRP